MAIKTKKMSDWLAQNGQAITNASKASMLKAVNDEVTQLQDGVFILCLEQKLYKIKKIAQYKAVKDSVTPLGIVVSSNGKNFVVSLTGTYLKFSDGTYPNKHSTYVVNRQSALQDYDVRAKNNTVLEGLSTLSDEQKANYAVGYCSLYSIKDSTYGTGVAAGEWMLPTFGYTFLIYTNVEKINYALSLIDGAELIPTAALTVWHTATEKSATANYFVDFKDGTSNGWQSTSESHYVRPIAFISNNL